jgi:hypothetical protein
MAPTASSTHLGADSALKSVSTGAICPPDVAPGADSVGPTSLPAGSNSSVAAQPLPSCHAHVGPSASPASAPPAPTWAQRLSLPRKCHQIILVHQPQAQHRHCANNLVQADQSQSWCHPRWAGKLLCVPGCKMESENQRFIRTTLFAMGILLSLMSLLLSKLPYLIPIGRRLIIR